LTTVIKPQRLEENTKRFISLELPVKVVDEIDTTRGDISRSLFVKRAIYEALKERQKNERKSNGM